MVDFSEYAGKTIFSIILLVFWFYMMRRACTELCYNESDATKVPSDNMMHFNYCFRRFGLVLCCLMTPDLSEDIRYRV